MTDIFLFRIFPTLRIIYQKLSKSRLTLSIHAASLEKRKYFFQHHFKVTNINHDCRVNSLPRNSPHYIKKEQEAQRIVEIIIIIQGILLKIHFMLYLGPAPLRKTECALRCCPSRPPASCSAPPATQRSLSSERFCWTRPGISGGAL